VFGMLFWCGENDCCRRTVVKPVILAQASQSRLGEMNRDSPGSFCAKGRPGDQLNFWASEYLTQARGVSPKRDPVCAPAPFLSPRLGEEGLAWASTSRLSETLQPWARPFSLERGAGQDCMPFECLVVPGWLVLVWNEWYKEKYVYNGMLCMLGMIREFRMTGWVWSWHVKWMSGLELKEHGIDMRWDPRLMGWWWLEAWIRNMMRMRNWSQGLVWNVDMLLCSPIAELWMLVRVSV